MNYPPVFPLRVEKTSTMTPITATVVNPIVAAIDISIKYLPDIFIARERNGARRPHHSDCNPSDSRGVTVSVTPYTLAPATIR